MSNDELKKKIVDIIQSVKLCTNQANCDICKYDKEIESYTDMSCTTLRIADALIAAGIGDVKEAERKAFVYSEEIAHLDKKLKDAEHRAEVAERALRNAAPRLNCRGGIGKGFCKVDECEYYHCNNDEGCIKAHLEQAEKELAEERKDD